MTAQHDGSHSPSANELLVLVRHAETQLNVERRFRGRMDPPLNARGELQIARLALAFDATPPAIVVTSPRRRAVQTATAIAHRQRVALSIDPRLDDVDYGAWTGLSPAETRGEWSSLFDQYLEDPLGVTFPGGESLALAQARAWSLVGELAETKRLDRVAVVTHDAIIRVLICQVLGAPLTAIHRIQVDLASTTALSIGHGTTTVAWLNQALDSTHGELDRECVVTSL